MWGKNDKELGCAKAAAVLLRGWFFHGKRLFFLSGINKTCWLDCH
jgi:hypothetical protein